MTSHKFTFSNPLCHALIPFTKSLSSRPPFVMSFINSPLGPFNLFLIKQSNLKWSMRGKVTLQWGSENRTCQVLEWSTLGRFSNGPVLNGLGQPRPFYIKTFFSFYIKWSSLSRPFFYHLEIGHQKRPVFECFRFSNGWFLDPHCIQINLVAMRTMK